jgi:hypothetical protein
MILLTRKLTCTLRGSADAQHPKVSEPPCNLTRKKEPAPAELHRILDATGSELVTCQLESADGRVTTIGSFRLTDGHGSWGSPGWVGHDPPVGARLLAPDGTVLATASFPKTAS